MCLLASQNNILSQNTAVLWINNKKIPSGWQICDGSNGTPDLRNRFLVGAGDRYNKGDIGGEDFHTLTIAEMPSHNHKLPVGWANLSKGWMHGVGSFGAELSSLNISSSPTYTDFIGGNQPHENRPPYYAVPIICHIAK